MNNQPEDSNQENTRKRKNTDEGINIQNLQDDNQEQDNDLLALSLSVGPASRTRRPIPDVDTSLSLSSSSPQLPLHISPQAALSSSSRARPPLRSRRNWPLRLAEGKSATVPAPFCWATTHRATVHNLTYLLSNKITTITGEVKCKNCRMKYEMGYELSAKFTELSKFIEENKGSMHETAPDRWITPLLPTCKFCHVANSANPVIAEKKKRINWLFLLLGQLLGCCHLVQLKYFCKHTENNRYGVKARVLLVTYLGLCKQLDPDGPFDP